MPEDPDEAMRLGLCIAGSAATVRARVRDDVEASGINYLLCRIVFGNLTLEQSLQSVALMEHEVMPAFALLDVESQAAWP